MVGVLAKRIESEPAAQGSGFLILSRRHQVDRPTSGKQDKPEHLDVKGIHFIRSDTTVEIPTVYTDSLSPVGVHRTQTRVIDYLQSDPRGIINVEEPHKVAPDKVRGVWCENNGVIAIVTKEGKVFSGYAPGGRVNFADAAFHERHGTSLGEDQVGFDRQSFNDARVFVRTMMDHGIYPAKATFYVPFSSAFYGLSYFIHRPSGRIHEDFPWDLYGRKIDINELRRREDAALRSHRPKEHGIGGSGAPSSFQSPSVKRTPRAIGLIAEIKDHISALRTLHDRIDPSIQAGLFASKITSPQPEWYVEVVKHLGLSNAETPATMRKDVKAALRRFHTDVLRFHPEREKHLTEMQAKVVRALGSLLDNVT